MNKLIALVTGGVLSASVAHAATISTSGVILLQGTNWSESITLDKFDPALGVLTAIKFIYGGSSETRLQSELLAAGSISLQATVNLSFDIPGSIVIPLLADAAHSADAFDGTVDFAGTSGFDTGPAPITTIGSDSIVLAGGFDPYLGVGSFNVMVSAIALAVINGSDAISAIRTAADASITVEYTYTPDFGPTGDPVPAPTTLLLFGATLLGLGLAARRKAA